MKARIALPMPQACRGLRVPGRKVPMPMNPSCSPSANSTMPCACKVVSMR